MTGILAGVQLVLFLVAVVTLIGAVVWRQFQRHRTAVWFRARLHDADPDIRQQAILGWIRYGLHRSAADLLALSERERDPEVLDTLADAVRARAWEPPSRPQITSLRRWGAAWHSGSLREGGTSATEDG